MISEFKFEESLQLNIEGKRFFFTHGHKYNMDNIPKNVDILVYGHFHTGYIKEKMVYYVLCRLNLITKK